jgi:hypothetical protein
MLTRITCFPYLIDTERLVTRATGVRDAQGLPAQAATTRPPTTPGQRRSIKIALPSPPA